MAERKYCVVNGRRIPILMVTPRGELTGRTLVKFSGGKHGTGEAGIYSFWRVDNLKDRAFIVRTRNKRPVGDRLRESPTLNDDAFHVLGSEKVVVIPALEADIANWLNSHAEDAIYAQQG